MAFTEVGIPDVPAHAHLLYIFQLSLAFVFLLSAVLKLAHPKEFIRIAVEYDLAPVKISHLFALGLIPLEAFLAFGLMTGWLLEVALPLAAAVLFSFAVAVAITLRRGRQVSCGCFGNSSEQVSGRTLVRLSMLLSVSLVSLGVNGATATPVIDIDLLATSGLSALAYVTEMGGVAASLVLTALWILHSPELRSIVQTGRSAAAVQDQNAEAA